MNDNGDLILREKRIVLPSIYRNTAVNLAHVGHLGLKKIKAQISLFKDRILFGLFSFSDDAAEQRSTTRRCYDLSPHDTLMDRLLILFCILSVNIQIA